MQLNQMAAAAITDRHGFWGRVTATLDWCESNYDVSYFVAEFWNTISNVAIILPAFIAAYRCWKFNIEQRIIITFLLLSFVGFGSWCFHMTLLYEMQLLDEVPMVIVTLVSLSSLISSLQVSCSDSLLLDVLLAIIGITVISAYILVNNPLVFQCCYTTLVFAVVYVDFLLLKKHPSNKKLLFLGLCLYFGGGVFWFCDNIFCDTLKEIRLLIPSALVPLSQFHSLWHIFAGFGSYIQVLLCLRSHVLSKYKSSDVSLKYCLIEINKLKNCENGM